jgi:hypothetical protein
MPASAAPASWPCSCSTTPTMRCRLRGRSSPAVWTAWSSRCEHPPPSEGDPSGGGLGLPKACAAQLLSPAKRRQAVEHVRDTLGRDEVTERRACRVLGQARNTHRRHGERADGDPTAIAVHPRPGRLDLEYGTVVHFHRLVVLPRRSTPHILQLIVIAMAPDRYRRMMEVL